MKKLILLLLLPLGLYAQNIPFNADKLLKAYNQQDLFTGNVLLAKDGKTVFTKSYGMADIEKKIPNKENTTFRIGSISKTFTAVVILQLQEKGLLNTEDLLSKFMPSFKKADSIKIKHLLSNSSGIRDFIGFVPAKNWHSIRSYKELIDAIAQEPLKFSPGSKFDYSSSNFLILCALAEKLSGKTYAKLLQDNILKKAGMKQTGMDYIGRKDASKAEGYEVSASNFYNKTADMNIGILSGAGGMYSSVTDLLLYDKALYGNLLLSDKSKELMFTPNKGDYGFGWEILNKDGNISYGHSGSIDGFKANLIRYPKEKRTLVILSNYYNIQDFELYREMEHIVNELSFEMPAAHNFFKMSADDLQKYEGEYAINEKMVLSVKANGPILEIDLPGAPVMMLYPESANIFYIRSNNAYGEFIRDEAQRIVSLKLIKGKRISTWEKRKVTK